MNSPDFNREYQYQENLSLSSPILLDPKYKKAKVDKMLSILDHAGCLRNSNAIAVDVGCSIGFFANALSPYFKTVYGLDIDENALALASQGASENVRFQKADSLDLPFDDSSVDLVICNHVYEHVPNPELLFSEIKRVLTENGVCYLGAASRLTIMEPHYHLPFLSWLPKSIANQYMRATGKGSEYYENLRTYWGLKSLISDFMIDDYTLRALSDPDKFKLRDMMPKGGLLEKVPMWVWRLCYQLLPSYILLLRVKKDV